MKLSLLSCLALSLHAVTAFAVSRNQCDRDWGKWNAKSDTCVCSSTDRLIRTEKDGERCKNHHAQDWLASLQSTGTEQGCGTAPTINSNLQCPKQLLEQIVQSSTEGSVFGLVGSPDSQCQSKLDSRFRTPEALEQYLATSPEYSVGGKSDLLSNSCIKDFSYFSVAGSPNRLADHPAKQAIATYYYLSDRLKRGTEGTLESIASIDSLLWQKPLHGVDCANPHLGKAQAWCERFEKQNCTARGGLDDLAKETVGMVQVFDKIDAEEAWIKDHGDDIIPEESGGRLYERYLTADQQAQIDKIEQAKSVILSQYPWIGGSEFRKYLNQHKAGVFQSKDSHPEYSLQNVHDAIYSQLVRDREASVQRLDRFKRVSQCLNQTLFVYDSCKDFDDVIGETPPLESPDLVGKDAECRWNVDIQKSGVNHRFYNVTQGIVNTGAITVATMGFGSVAAVGEMGAAEVIGDSVGESASVSSAVRGARVVSGLIDTGFFADGLKNASDTCRNTLIRMDHAANEPSSGMSCPARAGEGTPGSPNGSAKLTSDCVIAVALAAINAVPPALQAFAHSGAGAVDAGRTLADQKSLQSTNTYFKVQLLTGKFLPADEQALKKQLFQINQDTQAAITGDPEEKLKALGKIEERQKLFAQAVEDAEANAKSDVATAASQYDLYSKQLASILQDDRLPEDFRKNVKLKLEDSDRKIELLRARSGPDADPDAVAEISQEKAFVTSLYDEAKRRITIAQDREWTSKEFAGYDGEIESKLSDPRLRASDRASALEAKEKLLAETQKALADARPSAVLLNRLKDEYDVVLRRLDRAATRAELRDPSRLTRLPAEQTARRAQFYKREFLPSSMKRLPTGIPQQYRKPYQTILKFLQNRDAVVTQMQQLEKEVVFRTVKYDETREEALEKVLDAWEKKGGFGPVTNFPALLSPGEFYEKLRERRLFTDPALKDLNVARADGELVHGLLSHRLQWNLVMREFKAHPEELNGLTPADLYAKLGDPEMAKNLDWEKTGVTGTDGLWYHLFDNADKNFSSPENFRSFHDLFPELGEWH